MAVDGESYIIVTRNPRSRKLVVVMDDDDNVAEFKSEADAIAAADETTICRALGFDLIEVPAFIPDRV